MGIPQILIIVLYAASLMIEMTFHGQPKEGKHNVWTSIALLIIYFALLTWGGFFN